jgi:hypothetical protein
VLLGLLVAPSLSGALLGTAALVAFIARTPLRFFLVDRLRGRQLPRTVLAGRLALCELALFGVLATAVALRTGRGWWAPLLAAAPLLAVEGWSGMRSRGRRLAPELCDAIGIASVAAAIARAGGSSWALSLGLWAVLAARSIAAVPFVRAQVRRLKGRQVRARGVAAMGAVAIALVAGAWSAGSVPLAPVVGLVFLVAWGLWSLHRPPPPVAVIGTDQITLGVTLVLITAVAVRP